MSLSKLNGVAIRADSALAVMRMPSETVESVLASREIMKRPNLSGAQSGFFYRPKDAAGLPVCARKPKPSPSPPARSRCPRPNRSAAPQAGSTTALLLKKVLCPCLAAFVFGKTLSYVVETSAFVLFLLR